MRAVPRVRSQVTDARDREYIAEFQRRRSASNRIQVPSIAMVIGSIAFGYLVPSFPEWIVWMVFGIGVAGIGLGPYVTNYKCPRCDARPDVDDWSPESCENCGLKLK